MRSYFSLIWTQLTRFPVCRPFTTESNPTSRLLNTTFWSVPSKPLCPFFQLCCCRAAAPAAPGSLLISNSNFARLSFLRHTNLSVRASRDQTRVRGFYRIELDFVTKARASNAIWLPIKSSAIEIFNARARVPPSVLVLYASFKLGYAPFFIIKLCWHRLSCVFIIYCRLLSFSGNLDLPRVRACDFELLTL